MTVLRETTYVGKSYNRYIIEKFMTDKAILKYILSSDFYVTQIEFILINHSIENI